MTSPVRARCLHDAMNDVSSSSSSCMMTKTLHYTSSEDDDEYDQEEKEKKKKKEIHSKKRSKRSSVNVILTKENVYRRSTLEQNPLTLHSRYQIAKSSKETISQPCPSPATLLSCNLGSKLSMMSPVAIRIRPSLRKVLKRLKVADCSNHVVTSFEDVQTIRWLGAGVSAEVFKVRDPKSGELFAIKKSKQELRNKQERHLLTQEINVLEKLVASRHNFDHIVRYFQAWQEDGFFFLQMELCEGGTLQDFMTKRNQDTVPEQCLWAIIRDVATGLKVLHEHDIVHLDIKPDNIFITEDGKLKIGDFGMAGKIVTSTKSLSQIGDLEGDANYIAKELLSSAARLPSADIFCLGIMILEIATGMTLPEGGQQWHELREGKLPPLSSSYTEKLDTMIRQMMHPDATERPSAADILKQSTKQTDNGPTTLILEHALEQKLIVSTRLRNTKQSARNIIHTPRKTRLSVR